MPAPWEKYQQTETSGPWAKYSNQTAVAELPQETQPKGSSVLSKITRMFMGSSPIESAKTIQEAGANVPEVSPGEGLMSYLNKVKNTPALKQREESITSKGTLPQFSDVMQAGVLASGAAAPLKTAKILAKFGALEGLSEATGLNKAIQGIQQPDIRDVADIAKFGVQGGIASQRWTPKPNKPKLAQKAVSIYRTILRPTKEEIKTIEIRKGKNLNDLYTLAAEEQLPIKGTVNNQMDTEIAREVIWPKQQQLRARLDSKLASDTKKKFDLIDIGNKVKQELKSVFLIAKQYNEAIGEVDSYIDAEIGKYGGRKINGIQLNEVKDGMWSIAYDRLKPTAHKIPRKIGFVAKEAIEQGYPNAEIKSLNELAAKYATLQDLLQNAQGRVVQRGQLGHHFARGIGAIAGSKIPIVGPIAGAVLGGKVSEYMSNPERMSAMAIAKAKQAGMRPFSFEELQSFTPEIIDNLPVEKQLFLNNILKKQISLSGAKQLPAPTMTYGEGFTAQEGLSRMPTNEQLKLATDIKQNLKLLLDKTGQIRGKGFTATLPKDKAFPRKPSISGNFLEELWKESAK